VSVTETIEDFEARLEARKQKALSTGRYRIIFDALMENEMERRRMNMPLHHVKVQPRMLFNYTLPDAKITDDAKIKMIMDAVAGLHWKPTVTLHHDQGPDKQVGTEKLVAVLDKVPKTVYAGKRMIQNDSRLMVPLESPFTVPWIEVVVTNATLDMEGWDMDLVIRDAQPPETTDTTFAVFWHRPALSVNEAKGPEVNAVEILD
jgi:hypothetical protein